MVVAWLESRAAPRTLERVSELRWHRAALRWHTRLLVRYSAKLHPYPIPAWFVAGAACVHGLEGAWDSNTGNGYGGGMQFTIGTWNRAAALSHGRLPSVTTHAEIAALPPPAQVYGAYLIVVVDDGGSWREWPNTARACGLL